MDELARNSLIRGAKLAENSVVLSLRRAEVPARSPGAAPVPGRSDAADQEAASSAALAAQAQVETMLALARPVEAPAALPVPKREEEEAERRGLREEARHLGREEGRQEGHEAGHREGLEEGRAEAQRELAAQREADARKLVQAMAAITQALDRKLADMEGGIAELAFAAVCRMLGSALLERAHAAAAVAQVLGMVKAARRVRVRLAPADHERLLDGTDLAALLPEGAAVSIEADPAVALGGCMISSDAGEWDGRLETQLARLYEALRAARAQQPEGA